MFSSIPFIQFQNMRLQKNKLHKLLSVCGLGFWIAAVLVGCGGESGDSQSLREAVRAGALNATAIVVRADQNIDRIALAEQLQYRAYAILSDGSETDVTTDVAWSVDNDVVASITSNGLLTAAVLEGAEVVNTYGVSVQASLASLIGAANLTVSDATLSALTLTPDSPTVDECRTQTFSVVGRFADGSDRVNVSGLVYESSDTTKAAFASEASSQLLTFDSTLDANSVDTPITVTVTSQGIQGATPVSIANTLQSLTVQGETRIALPRTDTSNTTTSTVTSMVPLSVLANYGGDAVDITAQSVFLSGNSDVLTVDAQGQVTGQASGVTQVTASCGGVSAQIEITVADIEDYKIETSADQPLFPDDEIILTYVQEFSDGVEVDISNDELTDWTILDGADVIDSLIDGVLIMDGTFVGYNDDSIRLQATYDGANAVTIELSIAN